MNGPEHYRAAERLLGAARDAAKVVEALPTLADKSGTALGAAPVLANLLAQAQVHATLALAAATAYPAINDWLGDENTDGRAWAQVTKP
jgi:hypothetical protein